MSPLYPTKARMSLNSLQRCKLLFPSERSFTYLHTFSPFWLSLIDLLLPQTHRPAAWQKGELKNSRSK